jgi:hypothetical protein
MTADPKEFLVGKINNEAQREGIALSEVERKMLYFSETYSALPDIAELARHSIGSTIKRNTRTRS